MNIVFIGSGNLATHLSTALKLAGHQILQVYSPTVAHARELADRLGCCATDCLDDVVTTADAYIIAVKDDALPAVATTLCRERRHALFLHTAGSIGIDVFATLAERYGVLYPMQTFSKGREVNFREIPCFIEASDDTSLQRIKQLAESVSDRVVSIDSDKRRRLHLAAVFACNLANHCYRLAERELEKVGVDFSLYQPLIIETARKVATMSPRQAQTGPMVRYDRTVMERQLALIDDERTRKIYRLMADSIHSDK